ncbi:MAG: glycosyltransferase family 9 protein [Ignavibacteriales bacterium]|nr:glycosyltransferase family 9 protein [Ignavibacteriales bacterium]
MFMNTGSLGDVIISTMILGNEKLFDESLKLFMLIKNEYTGLLKNYNGRAKVICLQSSHYKWNPFYRIKFLKQLHSLNLSLCCNLTSARGISSDEIALLSGAQKVYCFANTWKNLKKAFSKRMDACYDEVLFEGIENEYERHVELIKKLTGSKNINIIGNGSGIFHEKNFTLPNNKKYIAIAPLAQNFSRTWGVDKFQLLCKKLSAKYSVILLGAGNEFKHLETIKNGNDEIKNFAGEIALHDLSSAIKNSLLFVGNDSGLSHLALRLNMPMIAIIGGGAYKKYFPYAANKTRAYQYHPLDCFGCEWVCSQKEMYCLTKVDVDEIYSAAIKMIGQNEA